MHFPFIAKCLKACYIVFVTIRNIARQAGIIKLFNFIRKCKHLRNTYLNMNLF